MRKSVICILILLVLFAGAWAIKTVYVKNHTVIPTEAPMQTQAEQKNWWDSDVDVDDEWKIADDVPENYVPVPGTKDTYMVIDVNSGSIEGYRKREGTTDENGNTVWTWIDIQDDIPDDYEPVDGVKDVYKKKGEDGRYYRYVRNSDGTYAFVECNKDGSDIQIPTGKAIPDNYRKIIDNYYGVYNNAGVLTGFKKRSIDAEGNNIWTDASKEEIEEYIESVKTVNETVAPTSPETKPAPTSDYITTTPTTSGNNSNISDAPQISDGTRTETKTSTTTEVKGNYKITYQTTVTNVYDKYGTLIKTVTDGPNEIGRELIATEQDIPDPALVAGTLDEEVMRVATKVAYKDDIVSQLLLSLNADRKSAGLNPVTLDQTGGLYKLSRIKAADMAIYNHADYDSPMYGSIDEIASKYGVTGVLGESIWKTTDKTANEIHTRFQSVQGMREMRMSSQVTKIAISIAESNGYLYIYECYGK